PEGEWQMVDRSGTVVARSPTPEILPGSWLLVAGDRGVVFFERGRQILGHFFDAPIGGGLELFAGTAGVGFGQVWVFDGPRVTTSYLDGTGAQRQEQALGGEGVSVAGTVYDPLSRPAIATKKMRYDAGVLGYRASFVTSVDWATGVMSG